MPTIDQALAELAELADLPRAISVLQGEFTLGSRAERIDYYSGCRLNT